MFGQLSLDVMLLLMLYAAGTATAFIACLYLLLRQGNAFARRVKTPDRLRLWTAAFFGIVAAGHLWYLPASMTADNETATLWMLIGGLLDCLLMIPVAIVVLLCMLQDRRRPLWPLWVAVAPLVIMMAVSMGLRSYDLRRRPLWPVWVAVVPLVIMMAVSVGMRSYDLLPWMRGYLLLVGIGLMVYMVHAVYQYGHWLRDNFADLEHKEVWQSFVVLAVVMLMLGIYASGDGGMDYEFLVQVCALVLIVYLLWRVETLQDLSISQIVLSEEIAGPVPDDIECLLRQHCEAKQLFLQRDLTVSQLAQALGINRFYLSQYFSRKKTTYNTYINELRINHFIGLYREAVSAGRPVSAKLLAGRSGYRSYSTFSLAFKQYTGFSVTNWMYKESLISSVGASAATP